MNKRYCVLTVESESGNFQVLSRFLKKLGVEALRVHSLDDIRAALDSGRPVFAAIIDVRGQGAEVQDYCRFLNEKGVPALVIFPGESFKGSRPGYGCGAKWVFKKPVIMRELADCIRTCLPNEAR